MGTTAKVAQRRARIAELLCANPGIKLAEIAEILGYDINTIGNDLRAIRREWANRRLWLYESHVAEDIARTDQIIKAIWPQVMAGKGWAVDRIIALLNYRLKALGLETQRHELDIGSVLANYLARVSKEDKALPDREGGALPAIEAEYKVEEPVAEGNIYKEEE